MCGDDAILPNRNVMTDFEKFQIETRKFLHRAIPTATADDLEIAASNIERQYAFLFDQNGKRKSDERTN